MRSALSLALSLLTALPATATARQSRGDAPAPRPWGRGTLMPSLSLGGSLLIDRPGAHVRVSGGLGYFVVDNLALGLSLRNLSRFLSAADRTNYPGVERQIATNEFSVTPGATAVLHRGRTVSPYLGLGGGPVFLNNGLGVLGEVVVTPGILLGLRPGFALNLGLELAVRFPRSRTRGLYQDPRGDYTVYFPSPIHLGFQFGVAFGPKVTRHRQVARPPAGASKHIAPQPPVGEPVPAQPPAVDPPGPNSTGPASDATTTPPPPLAAAPATASSPAQPQPGPGPQPELEVPPRASRPEPPTGRGLVIGGTIATFSSLPLMLVGVRLALGGGEEQSPAAGLALPMMAVGLLAFLAGVPSLGVGVHRLRRWRAWEREHRLSLQPSLRHRGATTSIGLTLRF